ncbi:calcium-binding protein [Tropicibacter naphthalenivorans]|uniref:Hemolysin IA n=1 Tax=Tropicibacter naphthalenivorans TaxID=441103 RepID=A0A0P1GKA4_9RHOB|nr:calcium-binding protein [Tropicibacter naphthalenivorans]CUH82613.1 Hemolysin IA [Tropicibacter naphthalenivorans]SMD08856.1 Hemolysin-type calcium-binding repeat-containing protein [Tropicibacter naphthalenivorans]
MTFQAITTHQSSTYLIQDNNYFVLIPDIYVRSSGDGFRGSPTRSDLQLTGATLTVLGTVAAGETGVDFFSLSTSAVQCTILVGSSGAVHAALGGIIVDAGNGNSIVNYGEVASGGYALYLGGGGTGNRMENHGQITLTGSAPQSALWVGAGASPVFMVNSGIISGLPGAGRALVESLSPMSFSNTGSILAQGNVAIQGSVTYADTVTNSGMIQGDTYLGDGDDRLFNSGMILGKVSLEEGADYYRALGDSAATEFVTGGSGSDTLQGGNLSDQLSGDAEDDLVRGLGGDDVLYGGSGNDTVNGGEDNDTIRGGSGNDRLTGDNGDDDINGDAGADDIFGGNGDDTLRGGDDADRLFGGAGQNDLYGQGGRDVIYAQSGEDTIIFQSVSDSAVGAQRDVIRGFTPGQDLIDLASVAPGILSYIGASAFSGAAREVRVLELSTGSSLIQVDTDGDGTGDTEILTALTHGLTEADFIL